MSAQKRQNSSPVSRLSGRRGTEGGLVQGGRSIPRAAAHSIHALNRSCIWREQGKQHLGECSNAVYDFQTQLTGRQHKTCTCVEMHVPQTMLLQHSLPPSSTLPRFAGCRTGNGSGEVMGGAGARPSNNEQRSNKGREGGEPSIGTASIAAID